MFLLMSRLVIGELGHAMPMSHSEGHSDGASRGTDMGMGGAHHEMSDEIPSVATPSVATDASACAEQEGSNPPTHTSQHCGDSNAVGAAGAQDCCQSGECECPCLHVPCAALDTLVLNPVATTSLRISRGVEGLVSQRPSGLFRPPARVS